MGREELCLFSLNASRGLGERIAARLGQPLAEHEEREFEDGEHKARPLESVRGRDVYVVQSLHGEPGSSANDKLIRLLFFIATLKDASAARVTAVVPYLAYARKDRRSKPRDPVGSRYVAQLFESLGTDRIVSLDVHNLAAYQNAFRIPVEHLEARPLFVAHFAPAFANDDVVVVSPDVGGAKRAEALRASLSRRIGRPAGMAFIEKYRSGGIVSGEAVVGDVDGKHVLIVDDLVSSGTTLARAAAACRSRGATRVLAVATHGVFGGDAVRTLGDSALDALVVTDSIPTSHLPPPLGERVEILDIAPLFAEAIRRLHEARSLGDLLGD
ncbi:ribose-phosphate pyrophosphokinase [Thiobacillus denitrificans ATCC 25259]|uniref:ribose-phosphate diphosphokinase n=1 Tax=Thiobacillus denitrificans (strain ATCC 25259 / T1) TaxID=292415 RepID=Q3SIV7_THIDA|nr:ribose-phosphate pyrophosphokinase [Thiobacillus denitrificans]AAZ97418.1 ribose-phosphate pyrophosphokinase [Thiobacillus denitrificans ATCC 25259]